jgi:serine/threonine-protein kinase
VPEQLDGLVLSLLQKDPKARPVDAHRVYQDLRGIAARAGVPVPPEEDEMPTSERTLQVLPSSRNDPWSRRVKALEQMLPRAYAGRVPPDVTRAFNDVRGLVRRIDDIYETCLGEQKKLGQLDVRGRAGRQRFGFAVDALGIDASRARDEVRVARAMAALVGDECKQFAKRFARAHGEIMRWEGRSAFQEPYSELAQAYRSAAEIMDQWLVARDEERKALESCETHQRTLSDLEFQIRELRAALAAHEHQIEGELATVEGQILTYNREAEKLEEEAMAIVKRLCEPLRKRPELKAELATLFKDLGEAAA